MYNSANKDGIEKSINLRIIFLAVLTLLIFIIIVIRAGYIQIAKNTNYSERSQRNRERITRLSPIRGRIFSSDGSVLASNKNIYNIIVDPRGLSTNNAERQRALLYVSLITQIDYPDLEKMLQSARAKGERLTVLENISFSDYVKILENIDTMEGVSADVVSVRDYPNNNRASHAIGYIGPINFNEYSKLQREGYRRQDWIGKIGVENSYENLLRGTEGFVAHEIDAKLNLNKTTYIRKQPALPGDDLVLSINLEFQKNVEDILADRTGGIIALKPSTGEVLAMASYPNFDPNIYILQNPENYNKRIEMALDTRGTPLINRTIQSEYPPGSTFKMISSFIVSEEDVVPLNKTYFCGGQYRLNNQIFGCWNTHGHQDYFQALANSCDVYYYATSLLFGVDNITKYAGYFGLGNPVNIDIPFERRGFIPSQTALRERGETWFLGNTLNTVIGQGDLTTTVLQLAHYVSVIANGGYAYKPRLLKEVLDPETGLVKKEIKPEIQTTVNLSRRSFDNVRRSMELVVNSGTAERAFLRVKRPIAGKTGTSEVGVGQKKQTHSLFVGYGPLDVPIDEQIVVAVLIEFENGQPLKYAGNIAAMVFSSWIYKEDFPTTARRLWYPVLKSYN